MSGKGKVLITDVCHPSLIEGLQQMGYTVDYKPATTQQDVEQLLPEYTGIVITTRIELRKPVLEKAAQLKFIARAGSGMENVDVAFAEERNIKCLNSPEGNRDSVAEHAMGLLLSLYHHIPRSFMEIKNGEWKVEPNRVTELEGQTIGLVGYGNTGSAFAKRLSVFGVTVLAYDKYRKDFNDSYAREATMDELYKQADVISLHIPLTPETTYLVNEGFLSKFSKPVYLLNTSRGKVVQTSALISALKSKRVLGAGLDVLENERLDIYTPQESILLQELIQSGEVVITPHVAGKSFQSTFRFASTLLYKIAEI